MTRFIAFTFTIFHCQWLFGSVLLKQFPWRDLYDYRISTPKFYSNETTDNLFAIYFKEISNEKIKIKDNQNQTITLSLIFKNRNQLALENLFGSDLDQDKNSDGYHIALKVLRETEDHPIVGYEGIAKYDPKRKIGFCFGRAAFAQVRLQQLGIPQKNIVKVFVLGKLRYAYSLWDFHVVTAFSDSQSQWWVIDTLFPEQPLRLKAWAQKVATFDVNQKNPTFRLYITSPLKFMPASGEYAREDLFLEHYNNYFIDLTKYLYSIP